MDTVKASFQKISAQAGRDGVKVELLISGGENLSLAYQKSQLEKFEATQSQMAGFRVIRGGSQGYAYTENLSDDSLLRTYNDALANANTVEAGELKDIPLMKQQPIPSMTHLYREENISMEKKKDVARLLEEVCLKADPRVQSVSYAGFNESTSFYRVLNSEGLDQEFRQNYYSGYAAPIAHDETGTKADGEFFMARQFSEIHAEETARKSVAAAVSRLGAKKLKTGKYPVVFEREEFATFVTMIADYFSAKEVDEKKSLFGGKLGQRVANEKFSLIDDPLNERGGSVRPFDSEGAPSQKTVLINKGILQNYLTNLEFATKMNLPHTANASRSPTSSMDISATNLVMEKGTLSLETLLKSREKLIYITKFTGSMHSGFKESTGDFSLPAEGFLYENGQMIGPVDQFVISGNIFDLLQDIEELGNEYGKPGLSIMTPDVLVRELSFAGA